MSNTHEPNTPTQEDVEAVACFGVFLRRFNAHMDEGNVLGETTNLGVAAECARAAGVSLDETVRLLGIAADRWNLTVRMTSQAEAMNLWRSLRAEVADAQ